MKKKRKEFAVVAPCPGYVTAVGEDKWGQMHKDFINFTKCKPWLTENEEIITLKRG